VSGEDIPSVESSEKHFWHSLLRRRISVIGSLHTAFERLTVYQNTWVIVLLRPDGVVVLLRIDGLEIPPNILYKIYSISSIFGSSSHHQIFKVMPFHDMTDKSWRIVFIGIRGTVAALNTSKILFFSDNDILGIISKWLSCALEKFNESAWSGYHYDLWGYD